VHQPLFHFYSKSLEVLYIKILGSFSKNLWRVATITHVNLQEIIQNYLLFLLLKLPTFSKHLDFRVPFAKIIVRKFLSPSLIEGATK